ncbi:hypothetical protein NS506_05821 [Nocardia seriolae]|uniref:Uncharacterized protein n=1 Tax=Nocardia seriolae TaxID=37332 RepID=A0ABC8AZU7_9NOCA|nr:hypothetical protein NS506_05821 [Nocardia seriolae]
MFIEIRADPDGWLLLPRCQLPMTAFMMVPALVAMMPPIMAPATIFGEASPPPDHFSQANRPPA